MTDKEDFISQIEELVDTVTDAENILSDMKEHERIASIERDRLIQQASFTLALAWAKVDEIRGLVNELAEEPIEDYQPPFC